LRRELGDYSRLLWGTKAGLKRIVFYSVRAQYYVYFSGIIEELLARGATLSYITSDPDDPIFTGEKSGIRPFYLKTLFPFTLPFLDAKVVVMTMPDLHRYHIRRSAYGANHVYLFHSLMSTHMGYRPGALDHFDTIFCAGPHHKEEIRRTEALYSLPPKCLLEHGYFRLEKIYRNHLEYKDGQARDPTGGRPRILIAPSNHDQNILATCAVPLVSALLGGGFEVVFRPHPLSFLHQAGYVAELRKEFAGDGRFGLDEDVRSEIAIHDADLLISDWSGVALEFAFGTERPVISINLPVRQQNPDYGRIGIPPAEIALREEIGIAVDPGDFSDLPGKVNMLLDQQEAYASKIRALRGDYVYNLGESGRVGADYIEKICAGELCNREKSFVPVDASPDTGSEEAQEL
jgi:YidC/Oxa1 family membrane protein insertase